MADLLTDQLLPMQELTHCRSDGTYMGMVDRLLPRRFKCGSAASAILPVSS
jgi:hypothetical protein